MNKPASNELDPYYTLNTRVVDQTLNDWAVTDDFGYIVFHSDEDIYGFLDDVIRALREADVPRD